VFEPDPRRTALLQVLVHLLRQLLVLKGAGRRKEAGGAEGGERGENVGARKKLVAARSAHSHARVVRGRRPRDRDQRSTARREAKRRSGSSMQSEIA
jgi:hypothetical protein